MSLNWRLVGRLKNPHEGLQLVGSLQWHLSEQRRRQAHPEAQPSKRLGQVSLQSLSRLLQQRQGQLLGGCQRQPVTVVADMPMGAPGASRDAPLMMSRQAARLSHKTKRGLRCQPGKPFTVIWLKGEQA